MNKTVCVCAAVIAILFLTACNSKDVIGSDKHDDTVYSQTATTSADTVLHQSQPVSQADISSESASPSPESEAISDASSAKASYTDVDETVYAASEVNIRIQPNTDADIVHTLSPNQSIHRTGIGTNGWSKVEYNHQTAYIFSDYLTTEPPPEQTEQTASSQKAPPSEPVQSFAAKLKAAQEADQIIAVIATGSSAVITMHQKDSSGIWREIMSTNGWVGSGGVGKASESASITPEGVYSLGLAFGVQPNPQAAVPYIQVNSSHYWVDDAKSAYYNKFVSTNEVTPDWHSAEHLIDMKIAYAYSIAINYNTDCIPYAGSAIFLHCSSDGATAGCVSVPQDDMIFILQRLSANAKIVIGTQNSIDRD